MKTKADLAAEEMMQRACDLNATLYVMRDDGNASFQDKEIAKALTDAYLAGLRKGADMALPEYVKIDSFVGLARTQYEQRSQIRRAILAYANTLTEVPND